MHQARNQYITLSAAEINEASIADLLNEHSRIILHLARKDNPRYIHFLLASLFLSKWCCFGHASPADPADPADSSRNTGLIVRPGLVASTRCCYSLTRIHTVGRQDHRVRMRYRSRIVRCPRRPRPTQAFDRRGFKIGIIIVALRNVILMSNRSVKDRKTFYYRRCLFAISRQSWSGLIREREKTSLTRYCVLIYSF